MLLVALFATGCGRRATVREVLIVPEPVFTVQKDGNFTLKSAPRVRLIGLSQNSATVKYISASMRHARLRPSMVAASAPCDIELAVLDTANPELGEEGYLLEVRNSGIRLSANTERGLFYAYQSLVQLLPPDVSRVKYSAITLPECTVLDYPRFEWRGAHLDVCRHYFPVRFVKKYIDVMAMYKLNRFHWHLTDDHGWRLPSELYPRLNTVGSWRVDRDDQPWGEADPPREGERTTYGGYYSKEDIAEVVRYAAERGIEVVPEIEMPGHTSALLAAYPQMACDDFPYEVAIGPYWPPKAIVCAGNDSAVAMLLDLVDEVCDLFPQSRYIHIGGDEAFKDNWEQCPKCQRRIRAEHLSGEEELQGWLMAQVAARVEARGKKAVGWDEVCQGEDTLGSALSSMVVMAWRGVQKGIEAAAVGHDVVMCPTDYCYLDYYQANPMFQPKAIGGLVTLAKAYSFDPMPDSLPPHVARHVLGGQCNLWTEFINTPQHAEYMLLPRMLAISECLWTPSDKKDWNRFRRKVEDQKELLTAKSYNFCEGSFTPDFVARYVDEQTTNITITTEVPSTYIFYTTDSTTPTPQSAIYIGPVNLRRGTYLKLLPVYKNIARDTVYEYLIK